MRKFSRESIAAAGVALGFVALIAFGLFERAINRVRLEHHILSARQLKSRLTGDSDVVSGSLSNGLKYYLQNNSWPEKRVELRLVVNAGSVLETDAQRGLAHAVEHMLFRGTKQFPARAIDEYFRSIGMRAGQDLNAWTSRDQTMYSITVPSDRAGAIDTAIAIFAEMAHAATFDPAEARTEAGIVFEEWRLGSGAGARFSDQRDQLLLSGSKYALRAPIGDTAVLRRFDRTALRAFYNDWYRPELMALVVVGDIDPVAVRKTVKQRFDVIPASRPRKLRPVTALPFNRELRAATLQDDEATSTRISLLFPHVERVLQTTKDYREWVISQLWHDVLNTRLEDAADSTGSPLLWTDASIEFPVQSLQVEEVSANIIEGSVAPALDLMLTEIARLKQHGLTARELAERSDAFLKERWQNTQWNPGSESLASSYANQFVQGNVVMTRQTQYDLAEWILPTITLEEIKRSAQNALSDSGLLIVVTQPTGRTRTAISSDELIARARASSNHAVAALPEVYDSVALISKPPTPGRIVAESYRRDIETFDIKLSNGLRVLAKPSTFTNDNIEFRLVAPGGASLATDADYPSALLSDGMISSLGVGPLSGLKLGRLLKASSLNFDQQVSDEAITFSGDFAPHDLDRFFEVLHLTLTAPRNDSSAFRRYHERVVSSIAHLSADPDVVFDDSSAAVTSQHNPRAMHDNLKFLESVDRVKALQFWNQRMANASGFTMVFTGSFQIAQLRPLLERYVASLPAGTSEQPRDDGIRFPSGVVNRVVYAGTGLRAKTRLMLSGPLSNTVQTSEDMSAVHDLAERVLGDKLRETMGGTYNVSVSLTKSLAPPASYRFTVEFEAAPERIDSLTNAALTELSRLSSSGPTQHEFDITKAALSRDYDNTAESNLHWAGELSQHALLGWSLSSIVSHQQHYQDLTLPLLRDACVKFLNPSEHVLITMLPQRKPPSK
ncbi:MAG: insulinase family protein [Gemmatimonas sp.]